MPDAIMSAADLDEYAATIRAFCAERLPERTAARPGVVRDPDAVRAAWRPLAVDLGVAGLLIPEEYDGGGATLVEAVRAAEALGAELAGVPHLASGVLAPTLLRQLGSEPANALLRRIAAGEIVAVAWATDDPGDAAAAMQIDDGRVTAARHYVIDADVADVVVLVGNDGAQAVAVDAADLVITPRPTFDLARALCDVQADAAPATDLGGTRAAFTAMLDAGRLALAAESAGGAQAALELAVTYAKQRVQFGREIGSFQAVKHLLADAYVAAESATSVARLAAQAVISDAPDAAELQALAAFYPADRFAAVAATGIQVHGGIGFTVECAAHLYRRRAESNRQLLGAPDRLRAAYVATLGNDGSGSGSEVAA